MPHLTLVGTTGDGSALLLVDDAGVEHTLAVDGRLRAAVRGETSRLGQVEITMDSALRPRDIQARIRAGQSPEDVAEAASTTVEKIMPFAGPVLAERQHVAERAQRSSVRRRSGESAGGARTLGDAVGTHLRSQHVDPDSVDWDAWRREDGRWTLTARFATARREGVASFTYDAPGSYVTLDDDDARWLVGESVEPVIGLDAPDDLSAARARRLTAVPEDELPLGDDALELVADTPSGVRDDAVAATSEADALDQRRDVVPDVEDPERDGDVPLLPEPAGDAPDGAAGAAEAAEIAEPADPDPADAPAESPARRPVQKKRGRASVPSWDEIMFGGRDQ